MKQDSKDFHGRRSLIAGLGVAAAGVTLAATGAHAQSRRRGRTFQPMRHSLDAWMDELPGEHRIFVDTASSEGGASALVYSNNLYDAQTNAYSGSPSDLAIIIVYRHFSTPFGYSDAIWQKYGEVFSGLMEFVDPTTSKAPTVNLLNRADRTDLPNFGVTIDTVTGKGAQIAICSAATRFISMQLAQQTGRSADDINAELVAGALPGARFVSAGVMALTRAQEYGYSLLVAG